MDGTVTVPTADTMVKEKDEEVAKARELTIKLNRAGHVDLIFSMSDDKSFNLVKEHKGNLYNVWKALSEEFEPQTEILLIELLSEFNWTNQWIQKIV